MMMCIQNLVSFCQFILKILSKNRILTSIKGSDAVANLKKKKTHTQRFTIQTLILSMIMCIQNLVLICLFFFQYIEQKPYSDINQGP